MESQARAPRALTRRAALSIPVAAAACSLLGPVQAQGRYPAKSVLLLIGFAPGGSTDFIGRLIAQKLSDALGQPVVAENRGGANGMVAAQATAVAAPDGYTLLLTSMGLTTNPHLYTKAPDPVREFTPLSLLASVPNVMVIPASEKMRTVDDVLREARTRPNPMTVATTGQAAPGHLASELIQRAAKVKFQFVAYKGSAPALNDVMAGHVDMSLPTVTAALAGIQAGKLRAIAVTGAKRSGLLPDVPTFGEAGLKELDGASGWYGLVGPAGLPREVTERLGTELGRIMRNPEVREKFSANGADPVGSTAAEMGSYIAQDNRRWAELVKAANIKAQAQ